MFESIIVHLIQLNFCLIRCCLDTLHTILMLITTQFWRVSPAFSNPTICSQTKYMSGSTWFLKWNIHSSCVPTKCFALLVSELTCDTKTILLKLMGFFVCTLVICVLCALLFLSRCVKTCILCLFLHSMILSIIKKCAIFVSNGMFTPMANCLTFKCEIYSNIYSKNSGKSNNFFRGKIEEKLSFCIYLIDSIAYSFMSA